MATTTIGDLLLRMEVNGDRQVLTALQRIIRYTDNVSRSTRNFGNTSRTANQLSSIFKTTLKSMIGVFAALKIANIAGDAISYFVDQIKQGIKRGLEYNTELEYTTAAIEALVGSTSKAKKMTQEMIILAAETPFQITHYAKASKTLLGYGVAQEDVIDSMKMLGNISLGNTTAFDRLSLAYGQIISKGKLQAEEVRQMVNQGFNPLKFIAEKTGESLGELQARMKKGKVTSDEVTKALQRATSGSGRFKNTMEALSNTYKGQSEKIKEYGDIFWGKVTKPLYDILASEVLPAVLAGVKRLTAGVDVVYNTLGKVISKVVKFFKAFVTGDTHAIYESLKNLIPKEFQNLLFKAYVIILKLRNGLGFLADKAEVAFSKLKSKAGDALNYFKDMFESKALPAIEDMINALVKMDMKPFLDAFNALKNYLKSLEPTIEKVAKFFIKLFINSMTEGSKIIKFFADNLGSIVDHIISFAKTMRNLYTGAIKIVLDGLKDFDMATISNAWDKFKQSFAGLTPLFKVLGVILGVVTALLRGVFLGSLKGIIASFDNVIAVVLNLATALISFIGFFVQGFIAIFTGNAEKMDELWSQMWQSLKDAVINFGIAIWDVLKSVVTGIIDFFKLLYNELIGHSIIPDMINGIINWFKKLPKKLLNIVSNIFNSVKNKFNNMKNTVVRISSGIYSGAKDKFNSMKSAVVKVIGNLYSGVKNKFNSMKSTASNIFSSIYNTVKSKISSMRNIVNDKVNSIKTIFSKLKTKIKDLTNFSLFKSGKNLIQTLINGIKNKIQSVKNVVNSISSTIKSYLGWTSPTKEGAGKDSDEWIPNLMNMMLDGFKEYKKKLANAANMVSGNISAGLTGMVNGISNSIPGITTATPGNVSSSNAIVLNVYADSMTNGRAVGKQLVKELNDLGVLTHKGG
jgi:tape measure domain-containing protein